MVTAKMTARAFMSFKQNDSFDLKSNDYLYVLHKTNYKYNWFNFHPEVVIVSYYPI